MAINKATFKGGVHFNDFKSLTSDKAVAQPSLPDFVTIPLDQHIGVSSKALVKVGDRVLVGQKIGEADANMSVPVHSSVSGEVTAITRVQKTDGLFSEAIVIQSDGLDEMGYEEKSLNYETLSKDQILNYIKEAGIVGLGGAAFPTHIKLNPSSDKSIDTVLINGSECEPFLTADQKVMEMYSEEIVQGIKVILKVLDAPRAIICIEDNKPGAIEKMRQATQGLGNIEVASVVTKYPQGDERMLVKSVLNREIPKGGLPADIGAVIINCYTTKSIYDALFKNKPLYERMVTVAGSGLKDSKNMLVRIGSPLSYLIKNAGGMTEDCKKIIMGGPMMGNGQYTLEAPVIKGMSGLLAFNEKDSQTPKSTQCIKCGRCVDACPVHLEPLNLNMYVNNNDMDAARVDHIDICVQCGSCSYVCPSKINLAETIKVGISEVKRQRAKI